MSRPGQMEILSRFADTDLPEVHVAHSMEGVLWIVTDGPDLAPGAHVKARLMRSQMATGYVRRCGILMVMEPVVRWDVDQDPMEPGFRGHEGVLQ